MKGSGVCSQRGSALPQVDAVTVEIGEQTLSARPQEIEKAKRLVCVGIVETLRGGDIEAETKCRDRDDRIIVDHWGVDPCSVAPLDVGDVGMKCGIDDMGHELDVRAKIADAVERQVHELRFERQREDEIGGSQALVDLGTVGPEQAVAVETVDVPGRKQMTQGADQTVHLAAGEDAEPHRCHDAALVGTSMSSSQTTCLNSFSTAAPVTSSPCGGLAGVSRMGRISATEVAEAARIRCRKTFITACTPSGFTALKFSSKIASFRVSHDHLVGWEVEDSTSFSRNLVGNDPKGGLRIGVGPR